MEGLFPYDERFPSLVSSLIDKLASEVGVERGALDASPTSLVHVKRFVIDRGQENCLTPAIFPMLVAYVGEVYANSFGRVWLMKYDKEYKQWEPWLTRADGMEFELDRIVYKQLTQAHPEDIDFIGMR